MFDGLFALLFALGPELEAAARERAAIMAKQADLEQRVAALEQRENTRRMDALVSAFNSVRANNRYLDDDAVWMLVELERPELFSNMNQK
jgi:hypothetical protein